MTPDFQALLGRVGSLSQLGSLLLIALFVGALFRSRPTHDYFAKWALAWTSFAVALCAIVARYSIDVGGAPLTEGHAVTRVLYLVYGGGKVAFLALLVAGVRSFVNRTARRGGIARITAAGTAIGVLLVGASGTLNLIMVWQCLLAAPAFLWCAAVLLRLPAERRTLGTRALGLASALHAMLWVAYGVGFAQEVLGAPGVLTPLLNYNSYVDAVLQTLLAYGMVLVVMEQTTRENLSAHDRLAAAHDALHRAAYTDPLTGLGNRKAFVDGVGLPATGTDGSTLAIIDVDNLKPVNDSLGHHAGDALIVGVADRLRECLREGDAAYRWGGDEFLLVFPGLGRTEVERILDAGLARAASVAVDGIVLPVRASYGCASVQVASEYERALSEADREMYSRKAGRRRETPGSVRAVS